MLLTFAAEAVRSNHPAEHHGYWFAMEMRRPRAQSGAGAPHSKTLRSEGTQQMCQKFYLTASAHVDENADAGTACLSIPGPAYCKSSLAAPAL